MLCPVCRVDLVLADRQGIEVDYCPQCRGIWLDRGELDKIIERNAAYEAAVAAPQPGPAISSPAPGYAQQGPWSGGYGDEHRGGHHGGHHGGGDHGGYRRGGFLGGLFRH
jgi:Zn-finger nucleic acid-binding protein